VQKLTTEEHRLTAAGLLFDYYTKKISSLRRAEARENSKTPRDEKFIKKLGKQIKRSSAFSVGLLCCEKG
jgi:hypothetical protein